MLDDEKVLTNPVTVQESEIKLEFVQHSLLGLVKSNQYSKLARTKIGIGVKQQKYLHVMITLFNRPFYR